MRGIVLALLALAPVTAIVTDSRPPTGDAPATARRTGAPLAMEGGDPLRFGDMVHYVLSTGPHHGEHRPAVVTATGPGDALSLVVFSATPDDGQPDAWQGSWRVTGVPHDPEGVMPCSWHVQEPDGDPTFGGDGEEPDFGDPDPEGPNEGE